MDGHVGSAAGLPREVPVAGTNRFPSENGGNPGIQAWRVLPAQDFDVILNRNIVHPAIPEHRGERGSTHFVFKEHELGGVSFSRQIAEVENPGRAFLLGIGAGYAIKLVRYEERNREGVL